MFSKVLLPLAAACGAGLCVYGVIQMQKEPPPQAPLVAPVTRPDLIAVRAGPDDRLGEPAEAPADLKKELGRGKYVAGSGIVEPRLENIPIGAPTQGIVREVNVKVGDHVKAGQPLFRLDDREVRAMAMVSESKLMAAKASLERLKHAPRAEDLPPLRAAVAEAEAHAKDAEATQERSARLFNRKMIPDSEYDRDRYAHQAALATVAKAKADLAKAEAGSWVEDIKIAEAAVAQAQAQVESDRIMLDRLTVRALVDGEALKVDVRPGQLASAGWNTAMVVLGDLQRFHVRVDIDEHDLHKFQSHCSALATLRGRPSVQFDLEFVRIEPYVVPKKSLTGDNAERVDTRVLQVIYAIKPQTDATLYVGQQMDVFIKVPGEESLSASEKVAASVTP